MINNVLGIGFIALLMTIGGWSFYIQKADIEKQNKSYTIQSQEPQPNKKPVSANKSHSVRGKKEVDKK